MLASLCAGVRQMQEADLEQALDKALALFRFLADRDIFENYYKQHLAKRLLGQRSVSDDAERTMITKLKVRPRGGGGGRRMHVCARATVQGVSHTTWDSCPPPPP